MTSPSPSAARTAGNRPRGPRSPLRRRIFAYVSGVALAACLVTVGVSAILVRDRVAAQRLTALERGADLLAALGGAPGALAPGEHVFGSGVAGGRPRRLGPRRSAEILRQIGDPAGSQGTLTIGGRSLLYAARATLNGGVVLVRPDVLPFADWRPFLLSLVLAGAVAAVLAAAVSLLLARRLVRPVAALAAATGRVAAGATEVAVPAAGEDELADLGRAFNAMASHLGQARAAEQRFLESVSHELRTPLTSIRGYAEALADGAVTREAGGAVIAAEAGRLERLVGDLLDLARMGRPAFAVEPAPLDLGEVAQRAVERHHRQAVELGVGLELSRPGAAPAVGDGDRLVQVVSNLIENALRVTPAGGQVRVRAAPGSVEVSDTGPGIAAEDIPRAFERFYLYDRLRSDRPVGTGLGLAIVRELVERMGGSVTVTSAAGSGATFTVRLPRG